MSIGRNGAGAGGWGYDQIRKEYGGSISPTPWSIQLIATLSPVCTFSSARILAAERYSLRCGGGGGVGGVGDLATGGGKSWAE